LQCERSVDAVGGQRDEVPTDDTWTIGQEPRRRRV